jgi:hypothetical protein
MPTAWTLTASEICTDGLRHLNVIGEGDTASGDQMQDALRGLDTVLKELSPLGYHWPKLSAEVALTWTGVQTMTLPTDYYGFPVAWRTENGAKVPLTQIPHATWVRMTDRTAEGVCTHFYVNPAGVFYVWPTPDADPVVSIQYQKILDDAVLGTTPDVLQTWKGALSYGVADEISMKFGAPKDTRVEVNQRWAAKKALLLATSIAHEEITFGVSE